jgi:hypothetical protein
MPSSNYIQSDTNPSNQAPAITHGIQLGLDTSGISKIVLF